MIRAIETHRLGNEEICPVKDSFLAELYRSTPAEARDLCLPLPEQIRASLALYCSARVHLRELARTIAATCAPSSLMREGRESGRVLWEEATRQRTEPPEFRHLKKGVTLAGSHPAGLFSGAPGLPPMTDQFPHEE
jgi:hypothetical protein